MTPIVEKVEYFAANRLKENLSSELCFHDWEHTAGVVQASYQIGKKCGFSDLEMEMVMIAAWFHDIGFVRQYHGHEDQSVEIARSFLECADYDENKIAEVTEYIGATRMPQCPVTLQQKVLCDADMAHLGSKNYLDRLDLLRSEWHVKLNKVYTHEEWYMENLRFLQKHEFFTAGARQCFKKEKMRNIEKLQTLINNY